MTSFEANHRGPRILLVRPSALGDVCRTVPALVTLRKAYPDARIDWLVQDIFAPAVCHHPALDGVIEFPRKRFSGWLVKPAVARELFTWCRELRQRRYERVYDLQGLARSGWFTYCTRAPIRVGLANAREGAWMAYNRRYPIDPRLHTVDRMLNLLAAHGHEPQYDMRLHPGNDDRLWLEHYLQQHHLSYEGFTILAPTAQWRCKCWPIERYIHIARLLMEDRVAGDRIILLAAPHERSYVQPILDAFHAGAGDAPDSPVLLPATTVGQMIALISTCRLMVCNDSAPLHAAVAFDKPIAAFFGPTDPALVGPYRRPDTVLQPAGLDGRTVRRYRHQRDDQSLIAGITVAAAWDKIQQQLSTRPPLPSSSRDPGHG